LKRIVIGMIIFLIIGVTGYTYFNMRPKEAQAFRLEKVVRGDINSYVVATGTLNAVNTVKVGSQISGMIKALYADYNSRVKAGDVIARIDPSIYKAQLDQAKANLANAIAMEENAKSAMDSARASIEMAMASLRQAEVNLELNRIAYKNALSELEVARANLEKSLSNLEDAERTKKRKDALLAKGLISQSEGDLAKTAWESAVATVKSARAQVEGAEIHLHNITIQEKSLEAQINSAKASLESARARYESSRAEWEAARATIAQREAAVRLAEVNLSYCTIYAPIDGIVISRDVDVGQTVAATLQSPTLFTIAQDLKHMQVDANVSEADVGKVKEGQKVTFTVDAYPEQQFEGTVRQVRNAPIIVQNVVTYDVVIDVDNREGKLKPGMTANVSILVSSKKDCLKVPNAALRFKLEEAKSTIKSQVTSIKDRPWFQKISRALELDERQKKQLEEIARRTLQKYSQANQESLDEKARASLMEAVRKEIRNQIPEILTDRQRERYSRIVQVIEERDKSFLEQGYRSGQVYIPSKDGGAIAIPVRLGVSDDRYTEIISGDLSPGQDVIVGIIQKKTGQSSSGGPIGLPRMPGRGM
jgi:HlyD family secretion protein